MTGPASATHAIMIIYDIFGYGPQILQGADILATSDQERQYAVFMPDFFNGKPAPPEIWPADTPEKEKLLDDFLNGPGETNKTVSRMLSVKDDLTSQHPSIKTWGLVGKLVVESHCVLSTDL